MRRLGPLCICLAGLLVQCGYDGPTIAVHVAGMSTNIDSLVDSLDVSVQLLASGRKVPFPAPPQSVYQRRDLFYAQLPSGWRGEVQLVVLALDVRHCEVARGEGRVTVAGDILIPTTITLGRSMPGGCRVLVDRFPESAQIGGRIISDLTDSARAPLIDCPGRCEAALSPGTPIALTPVADEASYFLGWSGACHGGGACPLLVGSGTQRATALFAPRQTCSPDGFCWERPMPQGNTLRGVWGASQQDVWAVGLHGTVLRQIGVSWVPVPSGTTRGLLTAWGSGHDDVWLSGTRTLLRWDGTRLTHVDDEILQSTAIYSLWGFAAAVDPFIPERSQTKELWLAGCGLDEEGTCQRGQIWHWQDGELVALDIPSVQPLHSIWGSAPDDIWAVGSDDISGKTSSTVLHWDGSQWTLPYRTNKLLFAVWGRGKNDVWFVGDGLLHYDGSRFASMDLPDQTILTSVWGGPTGPVWTSGLGWVVYAIVPGPTGDYTLQRHGVSTDPFVGDDSSLGLWGSSQDDILAVGTGGTMVRWNGDSFVPQGASERLNVNAIAGRGDDVWAVGDRGTILQRNGGDWRNLILGRGANMNGLFYGGADDVWMVGDSGVVMRWNGNQFEVQDHGDRKPLEAVYRPPDGDVWAVGGQGETRGDAGNIIPGFGTIARWRPGATPGSWLPAETYAVPYVLTAIWGAAANDVWAVGGHYVNSEHRRHVAIMHFDGNQWSLVRSDGDYVLLGVWGSGPNDIWAVGGIPITESEDIGSGVILHYDGSTWGPPLPQRLCLWAVTGAGRNLVWAAGDNGTLLRKNGANWQPVDSGSGNSLLGIWLKGSDEIFAVGLYGTVLRHSPGP